MIYLTLKVALREAAHYYLLPMTHCKANSQQNNLGQQFDSSVIANTDALNRQKQLFNQMTPLIDMGLAGAEGLTGNTDTFSTQGGPIYGTLGEISAGEQLNKRQRNTGYANKIMKTLGF